MRNSHDRLRSIQHRPPSPAPRPDAVRWEEAPRAHEAFGRRLDGVAKRPAHLGSVAVAFGLILLGVIILCALRGSRPVATMTAAAAGEVVAPASAVSASTTSPQRRAPEGNKSASGDGAIFIDPHVPRHAAPSTRGRLAFPRHRKPALHLNQLPRLPAAGIAAEPATDAVGPRPSPIESR